MGIRFLCPNGHKLNVKAFLAGKRGICPKCDAKFLVPKESGLQAEVLIESPKTESPKDDAALDPGNALPLGYASETPLAPAPASSTPPTPTDSLPASTSPTGSYRSSKRSRQERARKVTFFLGGVVLLLFVILIAVLTKNSP